MMWIDFEHEYDHIYGQVFPLFLTQGQPIFTTVFEETDRGWRKNPQHPDVLKGWQNTILEYHERLREFKRLHERNVAEDVLQFHAQHLVIWSQRYYNVVGLGLSSTRLAWQKRFVPDLPNLRDEVNCLFRQTGFHFNVHQVQKNQLNGR